MQLKQMNSKNSDKSIQEFWISVYDGMKQIRMVVFTLAI